MSFFQNLTSVQKFGALGVTFLTAFYMITFLMTGKGEVNPTLFSMFGSMIGLEEARKAIKGPEPPSRKDTP